MPNHTTSKKQDAINKHACAPFPEGWRLENGTIHLPDGTTRKILEEDKGGGEGDKVRYRPTPHELVLEAVAEAE